MLKRFLHNNFGIILINIILLLVFILDYGRFGDVIVDSFREAYIPERILDGKLLYRDIFTIYAPFSYLFNAFLFKIFGIKLSVLYFAGIITTSGILTVLYKISDKFLPKIYGFGICLLAISTAVITANVFNMVFPYSYGIMYGLLFALLSIYSALKKNYFLSYMSYSLAVCSKYEFVMLLPVLIWYHFKTGKNFWRYSLKSLPGLILPAVFVWTPLFCKGLTFADILLSLQLLQIMASAKTLKYFYSVSGLIFDSRLLILYAVNLFIITFSVFIIHKIKIKCIYLVVFSFLCFAVNPSIFIFTFPLVLCLWIINYKKISIKKSFIILSALAVSLKVFWASAIYSYGAYFIPLGILSLMILISKKYKKIFLIIVFMISLIFSAKGEFSLLKKHTKIQSERGIVYASDYYGKSINELIKYTLENTVKNDIVVVYPENLIINFMTSRPADDKIYSLIPMYMETFGEDVVISRLKKINPKLVVISNYNTYVYYFKEFGADYGQNIVNYLKLKRKQFNIGKEGFLKYQTFSNL